MQFIKSIKDWFNKVVLKYERPLTRYSLNILTDLSKAQESVQDTFLRLWKHGLIEEDKSLKVWLYKTCRNLSIDRLRKEGRMSLFNDGDEEELLCLKEMPSERLQREQENLEIMNMVSELPQKFQEVIRLKFQEELSYKEISEVTGYTVSNVGVLLHQSMLHLREAISQNNKGRK